MSTEKNHLPHPSKPANQTPNHLKDLFGSI